MLSQFSESNQKLSRKIRSRSFLAVSFKTLAHRLSRLAYLRKSLFGHSLKYLITAGAEISWLWSMVHIHHLTFPRGRFFLTDAFCLFYTVNDNSVFLFQNLYHLMFSYKFSTSPPPNLYSWVSPCPLLLLHCCFCFHSCCTIFLACSPFLSLLKLLGYLINIRKHHLIVLHSSWIEAWLVWHLELFKRHDWCFRTGFSGGLG